MSIVGKKKEPWVSAISPRNLWGPSVLWSGQNRQRYVRMIPCYTVPQHDSVFFRISQSIPNRASSAQMMLGAILMHAAISISHFRAELAGRSNTNCTNDNSLSSVYAPSTRLMLHVQVIGITDWNDNQGHESTHRFPFALCSKSLLNEAGCARSYA
ncbi:hypothetical protein SCLCIDRAFT_1215895 [Scleroderma citrinum Foug A]|uniref:Uncharacterized protein n=1 Tax=Scleroderma citrinum Foug A TaxID=1036808 RepID=A0A0C3A989_9AGAM|nr:hypothetical protein SCLCIDRAFT_1215895 [Scleroderma citrinum Foug A]